MAQIGLLSDTHGFLDPRIFEIFAECDEIWHAGDFGTAEVSQQLADFKPLRGVYGNVDDQEIRELHPEHFRFKFEQLDVWMTHIGGYPGRYDRLVRAEIQRHPPDLFICGHSHIMRVQRDPHLKLLHLNPGAAGNQGIHAERTMLLLTLNDGHIERIQKVELGPRGLRNC